MAPVALAVIGGTGLYRLAEFEPVETIERDTPYGRPSGAVRIGTMAGRTVAFLARHGESHSIPPHRINYRANLWLLKQLGAARVLAINAVGGIGTGCGPRALVLPDQLIDYTWGRVTTFCEEPGSEVLHVDLTEPYCPDLRRAALAAAAALAVAVRDGGCLGITQGPRLETRAEVRKLARDGCDLIGMTGMPEAALARELCLSYACLAMVANWAAGLAPDGREITMEEIQGHLAAATERLPALIAAMLERLPFEAD